MSKAFTLLLLLSALILSCTAQKTQEEQKEQTGQPDSMPHATMTLNNGETISPPDPVIAKLDSLFPNIKDVTWTLNGDKYAATFKVDGMDKSVFFTEYGRVDHQETVMTANSMPEAAISYLSNKTGGKPISKAMMVIYVDGTILYEADVEGKRYVFDGTGKLVRIENNE